MKEIRIDVTQQTPEELDLANVHSGFVLPECSVRNEEDETIQLGLDSCGD